MLYFDCSHTSHCLANTGIQRVTRSLFGKVGEFSQWESVVWDPYQNSWRTLLSKERELMIFSQVMKPRQKRSNNWTTYQRMRGRWLRLLGRSYEMQEGDWCLTPEIFDEKRYLQYQNLRSEGVRIAAVFHDAIPLLLPELSPEKTVKRFNQYLRELSEFDAVFPVSKDSKKQIENYWQEKGIQYRGILEALPLAVEFPKIKVREENKNSSKMKILTVGSWEGRKNHLSWLLAAEKLWKNGYDFDLVLVGMLNKETGQPARECYERLVKEGFAISWHRSVSDQELVNFYQDCDFTVYPSRYEGFGLPVLESLYYEKPCVCLNRGATGEIVNLGGCLGVQEVSIDGLYEGVKSLLSFEQEIENLKKECRAIEFRTWDQYLVGLESFLKG